eukprot:86921_1
MVFSNKTGIWNIFSADGFSVLLLGSSSEAVDVYLKVVSECISNYYTKNSIQCHIQLLHQKPEISSEWTDSELISKLHEFITSKSHQTVHDIFIENKERVGYFSVHDK